MAGRTEEPRRASLVVGVGRHQKLPELGGAPDAARAVAKALADTVFGSVRLVVDPMSPPDLLSALQKAAHDAREGALLVFFAGFVLDRNGALVLAVRETDAVTQAPAVPLSDVLDLVKREHVGRVILVLDAEHLGGDVPGKAAFPPNVYAMGSLRRYDKGMGDEDLVGYAKLLCKVLTDEPARLGKYLEEGLFDARALDRTLALDPMLGHATVHASADPAVVRDLRAPLAAIAEEERKKAEAEAKAKAEAEAAEAKAAEEARAKAEAEAKAAAEAKAKAEAEAAEAKAAEEAAEAAKAAEEAEAAAKAATAREDEEPAPESPQAPLAPRPETLPAPAAPSRGPLVAVVVLVLLLLVYLLTRR